MRRRAAIAKYCQVLRVKAATIAHLKTGEIVAYLRIRGYIYQNHKWVKVYSS